MRISPIGISSSASSSCVSEIHTTLTTPIKFKFNKWRVCDDVGGGDDVMMMYDDDDADDDDDDDDDGDADDEDVCWCRMIY